MPELDGALRHADKRLPHFPRLLEAFGLDCLAKHGALEKLNLRFVRGVKSGGCSKSGTRVGGQRRASG